MPEGMFSHVAHSNLSSVSEIYLPFSTVNELWHNRIGFLTLPYITYIFGHPKVIPSWSTLLLLIRLNIPGVVTKSVDLDQTPHSAVSFLVLLCLFRYLL